MPTLALAADGHHFIRHFYRQHATWQITADGVLYLKRRGVSVDDNFSTTMFMDLWEKSAVYVGGTRPANSVGSDWDCNAPMALRESVHTFHSALWCGDDVKAWESVFIPAGLDVFTTALAFDRFRKRIIGRPTESWKIADVRTVSVGFHWIVTVALRIGEYEESWFRTDCGYRVKLDGLGFRY